MNTYSVPAIKSELMVLTPEGAKVVAKQIMSASEAKSAIQDSGVPPAMMAQAEAAGIPWSGLYTAFKKALDAGFTAAAVFQFGLDVWALLKAPQPPPPAPQV